MALYYRTTLYTVHVHCEIVAMVRYSTCSIEVAGNTMTVAGPKTLLSTVVNELSSRDIKLHKDGTTLKQLGNVSWVDNIASVAITSWAICNICLCYNILCLDNRCGDVGW